MKKREVLPNLNKAINALVSMSADTAKLEVSDNDLASRRLKKAITDFNNGPMREFQKLVFSVRAEISSRPPTKGKRKLLEGPVV